MTPDGWATVATNVPVLLVALGLLRLFASLRDELRDARTENRQLTLRMLDWLANHLDLSDPGTHIVDPADADNHDGSTDPGVRHAKRKRGTR